MPAPDLSVLSSEAKMLLVHIYKCYLVAVESGSSGVESRFCGGSDYIQRTVASDFSAAAVDTLMRELELAGFLECFYASDEVVDSALTPSGIASLKNRFKNGLKSLAQFVSNFIP